MAEEPTGADEQTEALLKIAESLENIEAELAQQTKHLDTIQAGMRILASGPA